MNCKEAKRTKCIDVPLFVVNIALLYAFLLTVSHLLAWLTIANHERTIEDLKEILAEIHKKEKERFLSETQQAHDEQDFALQSGNTLKVSDVLRFLSISSYKC